MWSRSIISAIFLLLSSFGSAFAQSAPTVLLIGQSLEAQIDMTAFGTELTNKTGKTWNVVNAAIGGAGLLSNAVTTPGVYWTNFASGGPPALAITALNGAVPVAIVIDDGQQDAFSAGCTSEQFANGMFSLYQYLMAALGKQPGDIPLIVVPLGNPVATHDSSAGSNAPYARIVAAAEYSLARFPGIVIGPETSDLPVQSDNIHLTTAGDTMNATRQADAVINAINWPTLNAVIGGGSSGFAAWDGTNSKKFTFSNGNLTGTSTGNVAPVGAISTIGKSAGKWYWEISCPTPAQALVGIYSQSDISSLNFPGIGASSYGWLGSTGGFYHNSAVIATYSTWGTNVVTSHALDIDNGKYYIAAGGVYQNGGNPAAGTGAVATGLTGTYYAGMGPGNSSAMTCTANFGATPFTYTVPSGFSGIH